MMENVSRTEKSFEKPFSHLYIEKLGEWIKRAEITSTHPYADSSPQFPDSPGFTFHSASFNIHCSSARINSLSSSPDSISHLSLYFRCNTFFHLSFFLPFAPSVRSNDSDCRFPVTLHRGCNMRFGIPIAPRTNL